MGNDQTVIELTREEILASLNRALLAERQAVADYGAHAAATSHPDIREALSTLSDVEREHALRLELRITALGGSPSVLAPDLKPAGETLADQLARDLHGEQWAIVEYARLVAGIVDDEGTAELMTELLLDEIRHAAWLKATLRSLRAEG